MRHSLITKLCFVLVAAPFLTACDSPGYVYNNGTKYYNANDVSTDTLPSGAYTKNGQYINNPEEATNTRDSRGNRVQGYDHDVSDDYHGTPNTTVVYPAGTVVPGGASPYSADQPTTTTTVIQTTD